MKRILAGLILLLAAGLGAPYAADASKPPDTLTTYAWGDSYFGQVGTGILGPSLSPTSVATHPAFKVQSSGWQHACALDEKGRAYCWGRGDFGQLGNDTWEHSNLPVAVDRSGVLQDKELATISAGNVFTCAIDTDGRAYCWGFGAYGQLGDGTFGFSDVPVAVDTSGELSGKALTQIRTGAASACALDTDGKAYCWGYNAQGQIGDTTNTNRAVPTAVDTGGVLDSVTLTELSIFGQHACAVDDRGKAYCWGLNSSGQLGNDTTTNSNVPVIVDVSGEPGAAELAHISAGTQFTCGITSDGDGFCWGEGSRGQLGTGSGGSSLVPVPMDLSAGPFKLSSIAAGMYHACAVTDKSAVVCWGAGEEGRLGAGGLVDALRPGLVDHTEFDMSVTGVSAGYDQTCAVESSGETYCWGGDRFGELGDGRTTTAAVPSPVAPGFGKVSAGDSHTCAIDDSDRGRCWGNGDSGQLGDGQIAYKVEPVVIAGNASLKDIAAGRSHSCAIDADGVAYCWGSDSAGQLGNGGSSSSTTPVAVSAGGKTFTQITAGNVHTCAIGTDGQGYCWGSDGSGQLGAPGGDSQIPVAIDLAEPLRWIDAGDTHTCAVTQSGAGYCWGNGIAGRLGNGTEDQKDTPTSIAGGHQFRIISAGGYHTCAIDSDGGAWCWGSGGHGQLGDGDTTARYTPVGVLGLDHLTAVSAGDEHSCAANSTEQVFCWGANETGQLGDGTYVSQRLAQAVPGLTGTSVRSLSCGSAHTVVALSTPPPVSAPDPPTGLTGTAGDGDVQLQWTAPAWDGGSPITGYTVAGSPAGSCSSTTTACTIAGLANGVPHTFIVTAGNALGTSAASDPVVLTPVASIPVEPTPTASKPATLSVGKLKVRVKVRTKKAVVRWTRASNAAAYQVRVRRPGKKFTSWKRVNKRKYVVRHLTSDKRYVIRVRGISADDKGPMRQRRFHAKR